MQVYRDLEEYLRTKHYKDGLNKCNRVLKKSTKDPLVHVFKARFLHALGQRDEAEAVVKSLTDPAIKLPDSSVVEEIDEFIWESNRDASYPPSLSNGSESNKLWTNLVSSTPRSYHPALHKDRYTHAVLQQRWIDAGYVRTSSVSILISPMR